MARPLHPPTVLQALAIGPSLGSATRIIPATPSVETGTTYTFVLVDDGLWKQFNNAAAIAVTVPPHSSVAFQVGATLIVQQYGAGVVTLSAGAGVTINSAGSLVATNGQYAVAELFQSAIDVWELFGNLV